MFHAHVSSKGQIVIPKVLRERWGMTEGAVIEFTEGEDGLRLSIRRDIPRDAIERSLDDGAGLAAGNGHARTPAEMRAAVRAAFAAKGR